MIALYYRLSGADGDLGKDGKDESNSIENQRALVLNYLSSIEEFRNVRTEEFIDDGYTGTDFHRPSFRRMLDGIKNGSIDTVVVKDLSRFGRDYIGVGEYLEQIFPLFNVRFIAINDRYDSSKYKGITMGIETVVENLVNSMYSRDAGKKLYTADSIKWKKGYSTNGVSPFGYLPDGNGRYRIDPEAAKTVRRIFDLALEGKKTRQIAEQMNQEGYLIPSVYNKRISGKKDLNVRRLSPDLIWTKSMIWKILRNETYTGAMVLGVFRSVGGRRRKAPENQRFITRGVNEAIVTEEEFREAQAVIGDKEKNIQTAEARFALKKKLRCGRCHCLMAFCVTSYEPKVWCRYGRESRYSGCCGEKYNLNQIEKIVFCELNRYLKLAKTISGWLENREKETRKAEHEACRQLKRDREYVEILTAEKMRIYESYSSGNITVEEFKKEKAGINEKIAEIRERMENTKAAAPEQTIVDASVKNLFRQAAIFSGADRLTKEMADAFIETVFIHGENDTDTDAGQGEFSHKGSEPMSIYGENDTDTGQGEFSHKGSEPMSIYGENDTDTGQGEFAHRGSAPGRIEIVYKCGDKIMELAKKMGENTDDFRRKNQPAVKTAEEE